MEVASFEGDSAQALFDLLPVGAVLCHQRIITNVNMAFSHLFGYSPEQLIGRSLEILYPSRQDFVDRGEQWRGVLASCGGNCDERVMMCMGDHPVRMKVRGRCGERADPYRTVACTFELVDGPTAVQAISPREREIVDAMARGMTSKEIAKSLRLSHRTVETYRQRLMVKLGARNATQLLALLR